MSIWKRLKEFGPWSRARLEGDLEREIQNHLALEAQDSSDRGAFGNIAIVKEDVREAWGWTRLEQFARDVHYGLRQVRRNPGFSAIAIATLALGIGGVAAYVRRRRCGFDSSAALCRSRAIGDALGRFKHEPNG